jgi:hypothetical protein
MIESPYPIPKLSELAKESLTTGAVSDIAPQKDRDDRGNVDERDSRHMPGFDEPVVGMSGDILARPRTSTPPRAETIGALSMPAGQSPAFVDEHVVEFVPGRKGDSPTAYRTARVSGDELESFRTEIVALRKTAAETDKQVTELVSALKKMRSVVNDLRMSNDALTKERNALKSENAAFRKEAGVTMGGSPESIEGNAFGRAVRSTIPSVVQRALGVDEPAVTGRVRNNGNDMER